VLATLVVEGALSSVVPVLLKPKPRIVAARAIPTANSVMTVSAPFATDFSARSKVMSTMTAKNPAAANVSHIGNVGVRHSWSSVLAQAQFMRDIP
jgi:hypothetical protein